MTSVRMDVPIGIAAAIVGVIIAIALALLLSVLEVRGIIYLANPIALVFVGILYATRVLKRASTLGYADMAAGGAVAGATAGFFIVILGSIVGAVLDRIDFAYSTGLLAVSAETLASALLNAIIVGAFLAALSAAWILLVRTQRIESESS